MQKFDYVRKGYHSITPALAIRNAGRAVSWYKKVFGAQEIMCLKNPDGTIAHAELRISGSSLMLAEENPEYNQSPETLNGTAVILSLYVPDADIVVSQAVNEGAEIIFPLQDQFYGDRSARIRDPFGYLWIISSIREEITSDEVNRRFKDMTSQNA
jgi:PhnB protein